MYNGRNQIRNNLNKPNHAKKRSSSYAPKRIQTQNTTTKKTFAKDVTNRVSLKSLQKEREKRKLVLSASSKLSPQAFNSPQSREVSPDNDKIRSLEKQWEKVKKSIEDIGEIKTYFKSTSNIRTTVDIASKPFSQATQIILRDESPNNFNILEDISDRNEPHIQNVKQFSIQDNCVHMQSKHFVPITTINLGTESHSKGLKSFTNSEQKSTENSTAEKIGDSSGKIRNRSYEPTERRRKEDKAILLSKVKSKCILSFHQAFANYNSKFVCHPTKKVASKELKPKCNGDLVNVRLSRVNINSFSHRKLKEFLDCKIKAKMSRVTCR
jgi:predicted oxidoreductase (fatty acid repression mutant protein)